MASWAFKAVIYSVSAVLAGIVIYTGYTSKSGPFSSLEVDRVKGDGESPNGIDAIDRYFSIIRSGDETHNFLTRAGFSCSYLPKDHPYLSDSWRVLSNGTQAELSRILSCSYSYGLPWKFGNRWYVWVFLDSGDDVVLHHSGSTCGICI